MIKLSEDVQRATYDPGQAARSQNFFKVSYCFKFLISDQLRLVKLGPPCKIKIEAAVFEQKSKFQFPVNYYHNHNKKMAVAAVGLEPTPPKRLVP